MTYHARTRIALGNRIVQPGEKVSKTELKEANQSDADVHNLLKGGALTENFEKDGIHKDHLPVEGPAPTHADRDVRSSDGGTGA